MKSRNALMVALAVTLLAPMQLAAQGGGMGGGRGMGGFGMARMLVEQGSVEFLLSKATDLQLTAEQTSTMKAMAERWAESTKESREVLKASLPQAGQGMGAGGDREAMMQRMQAARPHIEKVTSEDEKAVTAALGLLTDAQKPQAQKLLEERRQSAMPRRPGGI